MIDCIVSGQASKFEILVGNYQQRIYASLVAMLGNRHDAEDVTQETFLTAFRKLDQFERRSSFYTWLHRIAFNAAIDLQRRKKRTKNLFSTGDKTETAEPKEYYSDSPASIVMAKETVCQVQIALSRLDEERRNIIVLRDLQGMDYAEIAKMLGIPVGTVRSRLHRARIELREIMNAMGIGDHATQPNQAALKNKTVAQGRDQR
ncbi:MAG: sigma-70 family RNA polymerase sigma factor [Planctomycetota bacterium]|nr:sigma-70 family RNA polymerase sigma factor [Planctomycetota bacterium]